MNAKKLTGVAVALAAASMFATATVSNAFAQGGGVKCEGGNACKGKSECKTGDKGSCKGKNECKGQGYVQAKDKEECTGLKDKNKPSKS